MRESYSIYIFFALIEVALLVWQKCNLSLSLSLVARIFGPMNLKSGNFSLFRYSTKGHRENKIEITPEILGITSKSTHGFPTDPPLPLTYWIENKSNKNGNPTAIQVAIPSSGNCTSSSSCNLAEIHFHLFFRFNLWFK